MNKITDLAIEVRKIANWHSQFGEKHSIRWHLAVADLLTDVASWIENIHDTCPETHMPPEPDK